MPSVWEAPIDKLCWTEIGSELGVDSSWWDRFQNLNRRNESFSKRMPSVSCWGQHEILAYCPPTRWSFRIGLNENANSFFATRCCFWNGKSSAFLVTASHKVALCSKTLLYQVLQAWLNKMRPIGPITADQRHAKEVFGKMNRWDNVWELLSKSGKK